MLEDKTTIIQVLGSLMKNPSYLSQSDKYQLSLLDFSTHFEKILFASIYNLYQNGLKTVQIVDIENYLEADKSARAIYEKNNGLQYLQDLEDLADVSNFDYYYNRLKKLRLLQDYQRSGIDISDFYEEDLTKPKAFEINSNFENLTVQQISETIKKKIMGIEAQYLKNDVSEVQKASEGIEDLVAGFKNREEVGLPIQGFFTNEIMGGARKGTLCIRSLSSGLGKALPNSVLIPTPDGQKKVGDVKKGDYLFDAFGKPTKVLEIFPQGEKEVWQLTFKDGRTARCCEEHLWSYVRENFSGDKKERREFETKTLEEINNDNLQNKNGGFKYLIPLTEPVDYVEKEHYIPPYIFGLMLGDGSFRQHHSNKSFQFSSGTDELPNVIGRTMGWIVKKNNEKNYTYYFGLKDQTQKKKNIHVQDVLKEYPDLLNQKSEGKYIPRDYLEDSKENRLDLLRGLLDTNGSVDKKGRVAYFTVSEKLKDNVMELIYSLGLKCSVYIDNHKDSLPYYVIHIIGKPEYKKDLFLLKEKKEKIMNWFNNGQRGKKNDYNAIIKIENLGYQEEMTCFLVDNDEHLFLTENYIVTHNTRTSVGDACRLAFPLCYNWKKSQWERIGNSEKVLFIATEQDFSEIRKMILAYLTDINENRFRYGDFSEREEKVIHQAIQVMKEYEDNFFIVRMPNPTIDLIKHTLRENCLMYGIEYVFYDYIFIGPALLNEFRGASLRNDELLLLVATALKDLAVELNVFIMTSTQVNANVDDNRNIRNESSLAGGRSTINKADFGFIGARPTKEELEGLEPLIVRYGRPNLVLDVFKVRSGQWTQVRVWIKHDLGTLKREELFVTDAQLNPIQDFTAEFNYIIQDLVPEEKEKVERVMNGLSKNN